MNPKLVLIVKARAKANQVEFVKSEFIKLKKLVRKEEGCIQFELLTDSSDSSMFVIYESWETKALWQKHLSSRHMVANNHATRNSYEEFTVDELKFVIN